MYLRGSCQHSGPVEDSGCLGSGVTITKRAPAVCCEAPVHECLHVLLTLRAPKREFFQVLTFFTSPNQNLLTKKALKKVLSQIFPAKKV